MQGRLSPIENGRIQSFPWLNWRKEFAEAERIQFSKMEWTIDSKDFELNPIFINQSEIRQLSERHQISIPSITNDYFMENPLWQTEINICRKNLMMLVDSMQELQIGILVIPLVDNSSIKNNIEYRYKIKDFFYSIAEELRLKKIQIAFELDLQPEETYEFICDLPDTTFGINYDIGNSASLGFSPEHEISLYGKRIFNVHIKDRILGGSTIALGKGSADFATCFLKLQEINYSKNYILQTARALDNNHSQTLIQAKEFVCKFFNY